MATGTSPTSNKNQTIDTGAKPIFQSFWPSKITRYIQSLNVLTVLMVCYIPISSANTEFYKPNSDDEIIAELSADVVTLASRVRGNASSNSSINLLEPQQQARKIMESYRLAANSNSARAYGHTLALLRSWPSQTQLPPFLRLIKADVLQHNHDFDLAVDELNQLLSIDPSNRFALQMKSQVLLVTGEYDSAQSLCSELTLYGHTSTGNNCQAQLDGLTGAAEPALARIEAMLRSQSGGNADALEFYITAAGLAHRIGEIDRAESYYIAALNLQADNDYVLVNYADLLLESGRAADAASLLAHESDNANKLELQLIYFQAMLLSDRQEAVVDQLDEVRETVAAMVKRGEERPSKLLARYYLTISHDYDYAHLEALRNWQVQKEPSDSWLLARAAVAAQGWDSLNELLHWHRKNDQQDFRIDALQAQHGLPR